MANEGDLARANAEIQRLQQTLARERAAVEHMRDGAMALLNNHVDTIYRLQEENAQLEAKIEAQDMEIEVLRRNAELRN